MLPDQPRDRYRALDGRLTEVAQELDRHWTECTKQIRCLEEEIIRCQENVSSSYKEIMVQSRTQKLGELKEYLSLRVKEAEKSIFILIWLGASMAECKIPCSQ